MKKEKKNRKSSPSGKNSKKKSIQTKCTTRQLDTILLPGMESESKKLS